LKVAVSVWAEADNSMLTVINARGTSFTTLSLIADAFTADAVEARAHPFRRCPWFNWRDINGN
jgi:hypothetical protein